jgi:hypothetical protein
MNKLPFALCTALLVGAIDAQSLVYNVELIGAQEVPANTSPGIGTATVTLDTATGAVSVSGRYLGLMGNASACHIHATARRGVNAGVILGLSQTGGASGTFSGSGTLTATQVQAMRDGLTYLNLHTSMFGGGEIRGQIDSVPGSGSPSAPGVTISGPATPGGTLQLACPPSINNPFVLIGLALPSGQTLPFPPALACVSPTNLGISLAIPLIAIPGGGTSVTIPMGVGPFELGVQCAFIPLNPTCVDLSEACRVAIRP